MKKVAPCFIEPKTTWWIVFFPTWLPTVWVCLSWKLVRKSINDVNQLWKQSFQVTNTEGQGTNTILLSGLAKVKCQALERESQFTLCVLLLRQTYVYIFVAYITWNFFTVGPLKNGRHQTELFWKIYVRLYVWFWVAQMQFRTKCTVCFVRQDEPRGGGRIPMPFCAFYTKSRVSICAIISCNFRRLKNATGRLNRHFLDCNVTWLL